MTLGYMDFEEGFSTFIEKREVAPMGSLLRVAEA